MINLQRLGHVLIAVRDLEISKRFYMDILGFVYGPARVTLFSSGALQPFPAAAEQRLFSLLLGRAKAGVPSNHSRLFVEMSVHQHGG